MGQFKKWETVPRGCIKSRFYGSQCHPELLPVPACRSAVQAGGQAGVSGSLYQWLEILIRQLTDGKSFSRTFDTAQHEVRCTE